MISQSKSSPAYLDSCFDQIHYPIQYIAGNEVCPQPPSSSSINSCSYRSSMIALDDIEYGPWMQPQPRTYNPRWTNPDFFPSNLVCLHWNPHGSQLRPIQLLCYPAKSHDGRMRSTQQNQSPRDLIRCGHPNGNRINPCSVSNLILRHGSSTG